MKQFTLCIVATLLTNISFATADDMKDFNQQTQGWEWLFTEKSDYQRVTYPVETNYRIFENHPDYRVRGRFVYDKNGNLKRVSYLLSTYYEEWSLSDMRMDYDQARDTLIKEQEKAIDKKTIQITLPKKCVFKRSYGPYHYQYPIFVTADFQELPKMEDLPSPDVNPLPQNLFMKIGKVMKENGMPLARKKLKEVELTVEQANQDTSVVTLYMVDNGIFARCNHEYPSSG